MNKLKTHVTNIILLLIFAGMLCFDLFSHPGEAATFDSPIHITNIAEYYTALKSGDFPVQWADGFANYGLPTPIVSQQLTSYLGALITFVTNDPLLSYKIVVLIGAVISILSIYSFLCIYASKEGALIGALVFNFSSYRLFNLYIRGALPEFFAITFIPLILIGIYQIFHRQKNGFYLTLFSTTLLILSHPFMLIVGAFIIGPYILYQIMTTQGNKSANIFTLCISLGISLSLTAWYLVPLVTEIKYFVIGKNSTQLASDQFLTLKNIIAENWAYYSEGEIYVRANNIFPGRIELVLIFLGLPILLIAKHRSKKTVSLELFTLLLAGFIVFLLTSPSEFLYRTIPFMGSIQFPWRMLSILIFIPPISIALLIDNLPQKRLFIPLFMLVVLAVRLPEAYGKNYTLYPSEHYFKTIKNLHFDSLNTIWTGNTASYPVKSQKGEIIEGEGKIIERYESNSFREYLVVADSPVRMIDNTFYFPGWNVLVDGVPTEIQFQDMNYRGVITYSLPPGEHQVLVKFLPTKVRAVSQLVSIGTTLLFIGFLLKDRIRLNRKGK